MKGIAILKLFLNKETMIWVKYINRTFSLFYKFKIGAAKWCRGERLVVNTRLTTNYKTAQHQQNISQDMSW